MTAFSASGQRNVIVTGAANGLGKAMAMALLEAGYGVLAVDIDASNLKSLVGETSQSRLQCLGIDLTKDGSELEVLTHAHELGPVYGLVNNAGIGGSGLWRSIGRDTPRFWDIDVPIWRRVVELNLTAVFRLTRAVVPEMLAAQAGRIVNITTSMQTMLRGRAAPYGPSKAGAESLSSIMSEDLAETGVTVNVLIPGGSTDTAFVADRPDVDRSALLRPSIMGPPLVWLMSDAAKDITGRRLAAYLWDPSVRPDDAAAMAGAPVAWRPLASLQRYEPNKNT